MAIEYKTPYHWVWEGKNRAIAMERIRFTSKYIKPTDCVLDVGCGDGFLTNRLAGISHRVIGIDLSVSGLNFANMLINKGNISFIRGDAARLPFKNNSFDVVTLFEVIEHVSEERLKAILKEIHRILCKGGLVILSTPNSKNLLNRFLRKKKVSKKHHKEYSPLELLDIFHDFEMIELSGIYLPIPFLHFFEGPRYKFIYRQLNRLGKRVPELAQYIVYCGKLVE